jgi:hypothetical protein
MWGRGESGNIKITSRIYREICAISMRWSDRHTGIEREGERRNMIRGTAVEEMSVNLLLGIIIDGSRRVDQI